MLLVGCKEVHGYFTFEKNGSGALSLKVLYPESSKIKDIKGCREYFTQISWNDVLYEGSSSINNPSGGDQCTYNYSFNDLDEVEKLHQALSLKLETVSINNDQFTYKALDKTCANDFDPKYTESVTWSVKPPGNIVSHNADKVIGDKLTWNLSGSDCYDVYIISSLTQPADKITALNKSSPSEKTDNQSLDSSIGLWTIIGGFAATMITTVIAYTTYNLLAARPINIDVKAIAESKAMHGNDQSQNLNVQGNFTINAQNSVVSLREISGQVRNQINQISTNVDSAQPSIKDLLTKLQQAIETDLELGDSEKTEALEEVGELATAAQNPQEGAMQKIAKGAMNSLKGIAAGLSDASKLAVACKDLFPLLKNIFGLP
jgi:hypothetical protein